MIQMHFGSSRRLIYGVHHPAATPRLRRGVLILNPYGWEALRAHRTLRTLALRLAEGGVDVLRFDYSCTGDSLGEREDASWEDWLEDADFALDELQALAGLRTVSLVGLRMGALLAGALTDQRPDAVDRRVLWAPPADGAEALAWARSGHPDEVAAFPVAPALEAQLAELRPASFQKDAPSPVLEIASEAKGSPLPPGSERILLPPEEPRCWVEDRHHGAGAVPVALLERIVQWITA